MNYVKVILLFSLLTVLFVAVSFILLGRQGMWFGLLFAGIVNFVSFFFSDKIALKMAHARALSEEENPKLYEIVGRLARQAGIPMPTLYMIDDPRPNAFATGRGPAHSAVAVTKGLVDLLDEDELSAVLGHELTHVRSRDILISSVVATVASAITIVTRNALWRGRGDRDNDINPIFTIFILLTAPLLALMIQMAISRSREFHADAGGAKLAGKEAMISALYKINGVLKRNPMRDINPAQAHMYIANPLGDVRSVFASLLATHPPLTARVRALEELSL